jgi:hypothetical protein
MMATSYLASVAQANIAHAQAEINEHATLSSNGAAPATSKDHASSGSRPNAPCEPATCCHTASPAPPGRALSDGRAPGRRGLSRGRRRVLQTPDSGGGFWPSLA